MYVYTEVILTEFNGTYSLVHMLRTSALMNCGQLRLPALSQEISGGLGWILGWGVWGEMGTQKGVIPQSLLMKVAISSWENDLFRLEISCNSRMPGLAI